jgi:hypothetical protein
MQGVQLTRFVISIAAASGVCLLGLFLRSEAVRAAAVWPFIVGTITASILYEIQLSSSGKGRWRSCLGKVDSYAQALYDSSCILRVLVLAVIYGFFTWPAHSNHPGNHGLSLGTLIGAFAFGVVMDRFLCRLRHR